MFKIGITSAYLNTPMNDNVKHKWLTLDKDVAKVSMSMDSNYWKTYLRRDGKILVKLASLPQPVIRNGFNPKLICSKPRSRS